MKIALFGGAFDPPHLGHAQIIQYLLTEEIVDEVWLVPTAVHDFGKQMTSQEHRQVMLNFLLKNFADEFPQLANNLKINWCEFERQGVSHSYDTLRQLASANPNDEFVWVMGADNVKTFHLWKDYNKILQEFGVLVYPRLGADKLELSPGMDILGEGAMVNISSTQVKQFLQERKSLTEWLIPEIIKYIQEQGLY